MNLRLTGLQNIQKVGEDIESNFHMTLDGNFSQQSVVITLSKAPLYITFLCYHD